MKIAGVCTVLNEADIIRFTINHLFLEGVDAIYVEHGPSVDDTAAILSAFSPFRVIVREDTSPHHLQPQWMTELSRQAYADDFDWIIPFDADEFWVSTDERTIRQRLEELPASVGVVAASMIRHLDWNYRIVIGTLGKAAFRASPTALLANGNHGVSGVDGIRVEDVLAIREICYRGFDHFVRKTRERNATIDPSLGSGEGAHQRRYAGMDETQLSREWDEYLNLPMVWDPIPSRLMERP